MTKKFVMSYSCGKDSNLALYRMIKKGHIPVSLLTTVDLKKGKSFFHRIPEELLMQISKSLNIDLKMIKCEGEDYTSAFEKTLKEFKLKGVQACAFGDIDLEEHREWCTKRCDKAGIEAIFPLWQEDRESLTYEVIESGFKAIIKNVKLDILTENFLGQFLSKEIVKKIKNCAADVCGENGEYHTIVVDGPIFNFPIKYNTHGNIIIEKHGYLDIRSEQ